ncbi:MAG: YdeI/OmpD-associated family protein [Actinobacteria bacterium]|nr:YdeI/OmpD-associated family protein [Actinomycetota bacterium]
MVHRFEARVEPHGKTSTFLHVPAEVVEALGPKKRVAVRVTVNGYTYRSTVAPMGGNFLLPLNRQNRAGAGVAAGDVVRVSIERDEAPRVVEVPEDLTAAIAADDAAGEAFSRLSYSHQREYVEWITGAKRTETRARRVAQALERLRDGKTAR